MKKKVLSVSKKGCVMQTKIIVGVIGCVLLQMGSQYGAMSDAEKAKAARMAEIQSYKDFSKKLDTQQKKLPSVSRETDALPMKIPYSTPVTQSKKTGDANIKSLIAEETDKGLNQQKNLSNTQIYDLVKQQGNTQYDQDKLIPSQKPLKEALEPLIKKNTADVLKEKGQDVLKQGGKLAEDQLPVLQKKAEEAATAWWKKLSGGALGVGGTGLAALAVDLLTPGGLVTAPGMNDESDNTTNVTVDVDVDTDKGSTPTTPGLPTPGTVTTDDGKTSSGDQSPQDENDGEKFVPLDLKEIETALDITDQDYKAIEADQLVDVPTEKEQPDTTSSGTNVIKPPTGSITPSRPPNVIKPQPITPVIKKEARLTKQQESVVLMAAIQAAAALKNNAEQEEADAID